MSWFHGILFFLRKCFSKRIIVVERQRWYLPTFHLVIDIYGGIDE